MWSKLLEHHRVSGESEAASHLKEIQMAKRFMVQGTWKETGKIGCFGLTDTCSEAEEILRLAALAGI